MSIAFIISLTLLLFGIAFLLISPLYLYIDTEHKIYKAGMKGLVNASVRFTEHFFILRLKVLFFTKTIDPLNFQSSKDKVEKDSKHPEKNNRRPDIETILALFKSFKIEQFDADIDTGDYPLNAQMIPLSVALNSFKNVHFNINFDNYNSLKLRIENNLIHLIMSFIKSKYSFKN